VRGIDNVFYLMCDALAVRVIVGEVCYVLWGCGGYMFWFYFI